MSPVLDIRPERAGEVAAIHRVHAASFETALEADLVDALRAAGRLTVSLVADREGVIVGHVAFSPVTLEGAAGGIGLAPVAVLPEHRRLGIAARLIERGLAMCRESDFSFAVVLGDPAYYRRFGFRAAKEWRLRDEYGGGDAFQALEFRDGAIPAAGGVVRYAPEFAGLE